MSSLSASMRTPRGLTAAFVAPAAAAITFRSAFLSPLGALRPTRPFFAHSHRTAMTAAPQTTTASSTQPPPPPAAEDDPNLNPVALPDPLPRPPALDTLGHVMSYAPKSAGRKFATSLNLFRKLRGRFPKNTILTARLSGALPDVEAPPRPFSSPPLSLPALTSALRLAAYDPRISHVHLRIEPLSCGWAKIFELRRHLDFFGASGKTISVYIELGGPKEFFLAMGHALYVPPDASLNLRGFATSSSFVRGVLDKIGILPQVERIGKYKSAGDQLARTDMSDAQREQLSAILEDVERIWTESVVKATGIAEADLRAFVDRSPWDMQEYVDAGLIQGICYESALEDALKIRFARKPNLFGLPLPTPEENKIIQGKLPSIELQRYARRVSPRTLGVAGGKKIAVIRAIGAITPGKSGSSPVFGATVGSDTLVKLIRRVRDDEKFVGCILRCDSPGGAALSSDIVWNELRRLRAVKPLVASQVDVAASGGYFLSMACEIVAEPLTVTGSVGVVTAKPSLSELYKKIGYTKENISVGSRYAELLVDDRAFSEEELAYFKDGARLAYTNFVRKAAQSRGKTMEQMEEVAQGRVWTGVRAKQQGLVDHLGGLWRAVEVVKERAEIEEAEFVMLEEVRASTSLSERLGLTMAMAGGGVDGSGAHTSVPLDRPLAMAEVDGSLSGVSPVTSVVADALLAPVMSALPGLRRWPALAANVLESFRL